MSECKHEKHEKSQDNSPEQPAKHGLFSLPKIGKDVLKEGLSSVPVLSKEGLLPDVSKTGILSNIPKSSPDLTKITTSELSKVIVSEKTAIKLAETVTSEVISKSSEHCEKCEGHEKATKIVPKSSLINVIPQADGVFSLLSKSQSILQSDEAQNKDVAANGKTHGNDSNKDDQPSVLGIGLLPHPPSILAQSPIHLPKPPNILPTPPLTVPTLNFSDHKNGHLPLNPLHPKELVELLSSPSKMIKTFIVEPVVAVVEQVMKKAFEKLKEIVNYFAKRPYLAMPLMVFLLSILTPVFLFILFAFITTAVTFVGFIIAESTVLAMGGMVLVGFLVSFFSVILMFVSTYGVTYIGLKTLNLVD